MANSANPEINKKIATSALGTLVIATVFFYLGDRYAETLVTYPGQIFDHLSDAFLSMWQTIKDAPFALDMTSNSLLFGGACFLIIWMIWLRYVAFIGNYRSGEESGSARWGTVKEGKKFKDLQTEDNNLLFTKNFGLALHRPKFDPEYDRNLNVLVVGGSGSGKTFNYVTPNICQLNTSYFVTDPKGTLLKDAGYLFTDNGYKLKSFNTINLDESMHYNPLKYVKTDTDAIFLVIDLVPMRRYECFRRRERFLGVLVFAKLIRISIADILVVSVITRARCKTEPKAPPVDEISNLPVHLGSLLPLNGSVPSLLLSINLAAQHTSKQ